MIYFPTPYPHEWWYSILCRYHVRSGNSKQQSTVRELFGGRTTAAIASVYPNSTIYQITSRLPPAVLDAREVVLQHTLFPYYMRFYRVVEKEDVLGRLGRGETVVITSIRRLSGSKDWSPCYCPQCAAEDRQTYGEAYWHIEHQIPMMSLCPAHGCRLLHVEDLPLSHLGYTFFPLESFDLAPSHSESTDVPLWLLPLCRILNEYYALPLSAGATEDGHSNLAMALSNRGYGVIQRNSRYTILDAKRLYQDLISFYGKPLVEQVFGGEKSICTINLACKLEMKVPERYALLQCFASIDTETVFATEPLKDKYEEQLTLLQSTGVVYGKKQLAEKLGITKSQLDILAAKYDIQPFWTQNGEPEEERRRLHKRSFVLDERELQLFKEALRRSGYRYDSHFARHCVMQFIKQHYKEEPSNENGAERV